MAKKDEPSASEIFENLQDFASRAGSPKASFTLERRDGWRWRFEVLSPDYEEPEEDE